MVSNLCVWVSESEVSFLRQEEAVVICCRVDGRHDLFGFRPVDCLPFDTDVALEGDHFEVLIEEDVVGRGSSPCFFVVQVHIADHGAPERVVLCGGCVGACVVLLIRMVDDGLPLLQSGHCCSMFVDASKLYLRYCRDPVDVDAGYGKNCVFKVVVVDDFVSRCVVVIIHLMLLFGCLDVDGVDGCCRRRSIDSDLVAMKAGQAFDISCR